MRARLICERRLLAAIIATGLAVTGTVGTAIEVGAQEPAAHLEPGEPTFDDTVCGNGNGAIEPNECVKVSVPLRNTGDGTATGVTGKVSSTTATARVDRASSTYPDIAPGGEAVNTTEFLLFNHPDAVLGSAIPLALGYAWGGGGGNTPFSLGAGNAPYNVFAAEGGAIPDDTAGGANLSVPVRGVVGSIADVDVSLGITHTRDADLDISVIAPGGAVVALSSDNGSLGDNYGTGCADGTLTTFDDEAPTAITAGAAPFAGSFQPEAPLSAYDGTSGAAVNGSWTLRVVDDAGGAVGAIDCVKIIVTATATSTRSISGVPIPDNSPSGADLPVRVSGVTGSIADLNVSIGLTHTRDGDLDISLVGPDGTTVELSSDNGGLGDNYGGSCDGGTLTTFDDEASTSITSARPPYAGTYKPEVFHNPPLASFDGKTGAALNGNWLLHVVDDTGAQVGTINCVDLIIVNTITKTFTERGGVTIPADGTLAGLGLDVDGPAGAELVSYEVSIGITHPEVGDLDVSLGTRWEHCNPFSGFCSPINENLSSGNGASGDNFGTGCDAPGTLTTFANSAASSITSGAAPFAGRYKPEEPLAVMSSDYEGRWTLWARDSNAQGALGSIDCLRIEFQLRDTRYFNAVGSTNVPDAAPGGASKEISVGVPDSASITDVEVVLGITHTYDADLDISLISPLGTTIVLSSDNGGSGNNYGIGGVDACGLGTGLHRRGQGTGFSDDASSPVTSGAAPFDGWFRPEQPLSTFAGKTGSAVNGKWTLRVVDDRAADAGTLDCFRLIVNFAEVDAEEVDPAGIPDTGAASISVPVEAGALDGPIVDVNAAIGIAHTFDADLDISLTQPNLDHRIDLTSDNGGDGDNYGTCAGTLTTFDDEAAIAITAGSAPFAGAYRPEQALGVFDHSNIEYDHSWRFDVVDDLGGDTGRIGCARVDITTANPNPIMFSASGSRIRAGAPYTSLGLPVAGLTGSIVDVDVAVGITHTNDADLRLYLRSPDGTTRALSTDNGGTGDNYGSGHGTDCVGGTLTTFDDEAPGAIVDAAAPFAGSYRPENALSAYDGMTAAGLNGVWALRAEDNNALFGAGRIDCLRLTITTSTPTTVFATGDAIPDKGGASLSLPVRNVTGSIVDVDVAVGIDHGVAADLDISLVGPDGTTVDLSSDNGSVGGYGTDCGTGAMTTFDDEATTPIVGTEPPFVGAYRPESALAVYDGGSGAAINGAWVLKVVDDTGGNGAGFIDCMEIDIATEAAAGPGPCPIAISVGDVSVVEGDSGAVAAQFLVTLSAPSATTVTVSAATSDGSATAPADYAARTKTISFAPGETSKPFSVSVRGDGVFEPDEAFNVQLSSPVGAVLDDAAGGGTIVNDEAMPTISLNDPSIVEPDSGTTTLFYTVTLSAPSSSAVTVVATTADGTALAVADYKAKSATVSFAPGEVTRTFGVAVKGDTVAEPDETFSVALTGPAGATIADEQGIATITNNDG